MFHILRAISFAAGHQEDLENHRHLMKDTVVWNVESGLELSALDVARAEGRFRHLQAVEPTPEMAEAVQLFARTEGLILDPVYTGKAAAGFIAGVRDGWLEGDVIFVHTGGHPALFEYPEPAVPDSAS